MGSTRFAQGELARLSYEMGGVPDGPPVVFLHATLGDHRTVGDLQGALAGTNRLILPDARGHGASAALTDRSFTVTDMANDAWVVLEAEQLVADNAPPLVLIGHGQGAVTALELARRRPDRVAGMILIEPDAPSLLDGDTDPDVTTIRESARGLYRSISEMSYKGQTQQAMDRYMAFRWGTGWQEDLTRSRQAATRRHAGSLSAALDALGRFQILPDELREIQVPLHVLTAGSSPPVIEAIGRRLVAVVPGSHYRQIGKITLAEPYGSELMFDVLLPQIQAMAAGRS